LTLVVMMSAAVIDMGSSSPYYLCSYKPVSRAEH